MTPEQTIRAIDNIIKEVPKMLDRVELFATNEMFNTLAVRVFNRNQNTSGGSLGNYKPGRNKKGQFRISAWQKKRKEAGRQALRRDLNFTGNLAIGFARGTQNGQHVVGFKDGAEISLDNYSPKTKKKKLKNGKASKAKAVVYPGTAKLSELIEENLDMVIFSPSVGEVDSVIKNTNKYAGNELSKLVDKHIK